jgi:polyphosphate kinase 2 (PPK2 family)
MPERMCQVVTLLPPEKRQVAKWHFERYVKHFPAAGRITIFDGSWYHVPAIQLGLGLLPEPEFADFLQACSEFERTLVDSGITLIKFWFAADDDEQDARFRAHMAEYGKRNPYLPKGAQPGTPVSVAAVGHAVLDATNCERAGWYVVQAGDKHQARLDCLRHLLSLAPDYTPEKVKPKARSRK